MIKPKTAAGTLSGEPATHELALPDGRVVSYCIYGPRDGYRVVHEFGTPSSRFLPSYWRESVEQLGISLLVADRPGYGGSTRQPERTIAARSSDIAAVTAHLGWEQFAVWGASGGAPHALACAAALGDRVTRCASVVGPAPFDADGLDWYRGMPAGNVDEFSHAQAGETALRPVIEQIARDAMAAAKRGQPPVSGDYDLSAADRAALTARFSDPGYLSRSRAVYVDGIDGWIDDTIAQTRPWAFNLTQISVPVSVWYGREDALCPRAHTSWLVDHIPGAEEHALPGGHILDTPAMLRIYRWLIS